MFCTIPSENDGDIMNITCCFAVDENDNVYIVIETPSRRKNVPTQYKLLKFDKNGNAITDRALDIIEQESWLTEMTATKNGKLVFYCRFIKSMYIYDSTNAEKDYKLPLPLKNVCPDDITELSFTVSDQNEIIYTFSKRNDDKPFVMHIITMDGKLKHEVPNNEEQIPAATNHVCFMNVVLNHVNKTILVSLYSGGDSISLFSFSKTGELLYEFKIPDWHSHQLISHLNGPVALVDKLRVMMLQM